MVIFAAVGAAIQGLNQHNQYTALTVATTGGPDSLTLMFATMQRHGYVIDEVFFGLWLVPLGYLVIRSGYVPKLLGQLLIVACAGYLIDLFTQVLAPSRSSLAATVITYPAGALGELIFLLWLLERAIPASRLASANLPHWTSPTLSTRAPRGVAYLGDIVIDCAHPASLASGPACSTTTRWHLQRGRTGPAASQ
jgi:hypothetical protein